MARKGIRDALSWGRREPASGFGLIALAAGLLVGLAAGAYFADRLGGLAGIKSRVRDRLKSGIPRRDARHPDKQPADVEAGAREDEEDEEHDYEEEYEDAEFHSADEALEERVLEAFTNDPVLAERAVDIGAIGPATIELTGWVYTPDEMEYASTLTRGIPGVESVVNALTVRTESQQSAP